MHAITLTQNATQDDLSDSDYREIYSELRENISLDKFKLLINSEFSKALWSQYHNDQIELNRKMRNELRIAVGRPSLPPTVEESIRGVDPDAAVVQVGDETPDRVLLIGTREDLKITLINGSVSACPVTEVTRPIRPSRRLIRPVASSAQNEARMQINRSWTEIIDAGILYFLGSEKEIKNG